MRCVRLRGALALAALAALTACSSPEERFEEHLARAQTHLENDRIDDALLELQGALKIDPESAEVNERLGRLLAEQGAYQPAVFHLGEAYRLDPTRVDAAMRQASLIWRSSPRRAQSIIEEAGRLHPNDPRVLRTRSGLMVVMHDNEAALADALAALKLAPDEIDSWLQLGMVHLARIREESGPRKPAPDELYEAAIAAFQKIDDIEGGHTGARLEIARVYAAWRGHRAKAAEAYRSALALAAESGNAVHLAGAARATEEWARHTRRPKLQLEALEKLVEAQPDRVDSWERLARATAAAEGPEAAEKVYLRLLEQRPDEPNSHIAYTSYLARNRRDAEAIAHLDARRRGGDQNILLAEQLLRLYLSQGNAAAARTVYGEMTDLDEHDPASRRSAARLALAENRPHDVLEILSEFVGERESAETEQLRAVALMRLDSLPAATAAADRAIALAPYSPVPAMRLKLTILGKAEEWKAVERTLDELEALGHEPTPAERLLRAQALYGSGDADAGRAELEAILDGPIPFPPAALEFAKRESAKSPARARRNLAKSLRFAPGNFELIEAITRLDQRTGRLKQALARLDRVVEAQLAGPRLLLLRAEMLAHSGQLDRAEADALRAFEASPELPGGADLLFAIYEAQGKLDEARRSFEEAESVGVLHVGARVLLGRLYLAAGEVDKAAAMYERVVEENPSIAPAKNDLAFLLASQGRDLDRALTLAEEAQRALPDNPSAADTVGYVYLRKGHLEAALQQFRYAIELANGQLGQAPPTLHYHLGLTLAALERNEEAAKAFEKALSIDPDFSGADDARQRLQAARPRDAKGSS